VWHLKKTENKTGVYHAKGILAGIENFDDENVLVKCRYENCLYNMSSVITLKENSYDLAVTFGA